MIYLDTALLAALAQPCVGAFIGYLTNKIAIRMLFRPLRPWYVFKWRLPLTPGIIPSKRHELAVNIGEMVGMRLLTSEEIGRAISGEAFQEHLHNLITRRLALFWYREFPSLQELFPAESGSAVSDLQAGLSKKLKEKLTHYLAGPEAEARLAGWLQHAGNTIFDDQVESAPLRRVAEQFVQQLPAGGGEQISHAISQILNALLQEAGAEKKRLAELLPEEFTGHLHAFIGAQSPVILERIAQQILAEEARPALLESLLTVVHQLLGSLGPMGAMALGFFEADTFKRKISEYLDKNRESIVNRLTSPQLQKRLAQVLQESMDTVLDKEIAELLANLSPERKHGLCTAIGAQVAAALRTEAAVAQLTIALSGMLRRLLQEGQSGEGKASPAELVLSLLRSGRGASFLHTAVDSLVRQVFNLPLSRVIGGMPDEARTLVADRAIRYANHLFLHELSGLVQAINIKELVSEKVDSLDLLQLERLLLGIMEEQFKYINLFGALLGFLIGLINLLLFQLR
ncbi:MAG: DUF445 family protein [bacterium]|nr:DUF445 family protein [bacterium]